MSLDVVILFPGGYRPMHGGHLDLIKRYALNDDVKNIKVMIGPCIRDGITQELATLIARQLTCDIEKVSIETTSYPTPVTALYKYMDTVDSGNYAVAASSKGEDYKKVIKFLNDYSVGGRYHDSSKNLSAIDLCIDSEPLTYSGRHDSHEGEPISASVLRDDINNNDLESFLTNYPNTDILESMNVWRLIKESSHNDANLHMTHIEDLVYSNGPEGMLKCMMMMDDGFYTMMRVNERAKITVKFDGSPAVFCWSSFPGLKDNGVALKSLFNTNSITMYDDDDVLRVSAGRDDLKEKLGSLLSNIKDLNIPAGEIWQGDFMYDSLENVKIMGKNYITFQPNTLCYALDEHFSDLDKVLASKIGMVWHTIYRGENLRSAKCSYDVDLSVLSPSPSIYSFNHNVPFDTHPSRITIKEAKFMGSIMLNYHTSVKKLLSDKRYRTLVRNDEFIDLFSVYVNSIIRKKTVINNYRDYEDHLMIFLLERYSRQISLKKTDKTKRIYLHKMRKMMELILSSDDVIKQMYNLMNTIRRLKALAISKLDEKSSMRTFVRKGANEYVRATHEGYVFHAGYASVKLVNRFQFSSYNFSDDVMKGWNK